MRGTESTGRRAPPLVALVGNSNVGKSVLFNRLTGRYAQVSNYPGTTVALTRGTATISGKAYEILDTPGVNSLVPQSEDERVTRDILFRERPDVVVVVADSKHVRRTLLLLSQLADLNLPMVLALNMSDESRVRGLHLDVARLRDLFGIPVVETVATEGHGIRELREALSAPEVPRDPVLDTAAIEEELRALAARNGRLPMNLIVESLSSDESDPSLLALLSPEDRAAISESIEVYRTRHRREAARAIVQARERWLEATTKALLRQADRIERPFVDRLGKWCREPLTGLPLLLGVLLVVYYFVGVFGAGVAVDFLEELVFGAYVVPAIAWAIDRLLPFDFARDFFVGRYGVVSMGLTYSVAIVLPVVSTFFIALGLLEDSGYLPRLAVLTDRLFRLMGLNGKAVIPMVLGLGCVTMATLSTRILPTRKERLLATLLLALGVPCAAQLGVVVGVLAWISFRALVLLFAVVAMQLLLVGWVADKVIPGKRSDFLMELPPMRLPLWSNLAHKTWSRVRWFLREAVPLFILGTVILFALDRLRVLPFVVATAEPVVVGLLGLPPKAAEAFVMGFLRRDYGAAGLFDLARQGLMDPPQIFVSLVTMTLFVPCVANFLVMIKEHDFRKAALVSGFIIPYAIAVGACVNLFLRWSGMPL